MRLNYENCSFKSILFQALKQYSDYKSLIAKTFNGNTLLMKTVNAIQVIRSKKQYSQVSLDLTCTLVLSNHISACMNCAPEKSGAQKKTYPPLILGNICIAIVCFPGCGVTNVQIKLFIYMNKNSRQKFKYLENRKRF